MKKLPLFLSILSMVALPIAHATTVGFSPAPTSRTVVDALGSTITNANSLALAGNFISEAFVFNPALSIAANVSAITLTGGWKQFGLDTVTLATDPGVALPGLNISAAGKLGGSIVDNNAGATQAAYYNAKNLYIWLFNAPTVAAATQMGIFRSTDASVPWAFATTNGGVGDVLTYSTLISAAPTILAIGGTGSVQAAGGTFTNGALQLAATVPEPSVLALGGLAGLGMLASRRRRQRE